MKNLIAALICCVFIGFSCEKDLSISVKHTCYLVTIDGKPVAGKRVRYFNVPLNVDTVLPFDAKNDLFVEKTSDKSGRVVLDTIYTLKNNWLKVAVETSANEFALNDAQVADNVTDTLYFDKLIPYKLRLKSAENNKNSTYSLRRVGLGSYISQRYDSKQLFYWSDATPTKAPFDTVFNIRMFVQARCTGGAFANFTNTDVGNVSITSLDYAAFRADSTLTITF